MEIQTNYYTIKPRNNLLYIESFYSWDEEIAMDFAGDVRQVILDNYLGTTWAVLHDVSQWELGTPQINEIISRFLSTPLTGLLDRHAIVTGTSKIRIWQVENIIKDIDQFQIRLFTTQNQAMAWLSDSGYCLDPN